MALALRFDRQTYTFAKPEQSTLPMCIDLKYLLDEVIGEDHGYCRANHRWRADTTFNDLGSYLNLCAREGITKVEISHLNVFHSRYCNGIRVHYRLTFSDGRTEGFSTPEYLFNIGYYESYENPTKSTITLQDGEYLAEIRTRQGEITDQITFITNQRTLSFGGNGGSGEDMSAPLDLSRRIVAFVGTSRGILEKLGAISVSRNWEEVLFSFVHLLRKIVLLSYYKTGVVML